MCSRRCWSRSRGSASPWSRWTSACLRNQRALGRVQLQEQREKTTIRRLESVHDAIAKTEKDASAAETSLAGFKKMFKDSGMLVQGNPLTEMIGGL